MATKPCLTDVARVREDDCLARVQDLQAGTERCIYRQCRNPRDRGKWCSVHEPLSLPGRGRLPEWKGPIPGLEPVVFRPAPLDQRIRMMALWQSTDKYTCERLHGLGPQEEVKSMATLPKPPRTETKRKRTQTLVPSSEELSFQERLERISNLTPGTIVCGYVVTRKLGQGSYGVVYAVREYHPLTEGYRAVEKVERRKRESKLAALRRRSTRESKEQKEGEDESEEWGEEWAIKLIPTSLSQGQLDAVMVVEGTAMASLRHPHLMSARMVHVDCQPLSSVPSKDKKRVRELPPGTLAIVMPLGQSVYEFLEAHEGQEDEETVRIQLLYDILCGLRHLWTAGFVHRDLKPENILIVYHSADEKKMTGREWVAKISDFGSMKRFLTPQPLEIVGTPSYMAPERLIPLVTGKFDSRAVGFQELVGADMWSLGILAFQILQYTSKDHEHEWSSDPLLSPTDAEALEAAEEEGKTRAELYGRLAANSIAIVHPSPRDLEQVPDSILHLVKILPGATTYERLFGLKGFADANAEIGVMFNNMLRWRPLERSVAWGFDRFDEKVIKNCRNMDPVPELKDIRTRPWCRDDRHDKSKPLCIDAPFRFTSLSLPFALVSMANDIYYSYTCSLPADEEEEEKESSYSEVERKLASMLIAAKQFDVDKWPEVQRWMEQVAERDKILDRRVQTLVQHILEVIRWRPATFPFYCSQSLARVEKKLALDEYSSKETNRSRYRGKARSIRSSVPRPRQAERGPITRSRYRAMHFSPH